MITIDVKIKDGEVKALLTQLKERVGNLTPAMQEIGQIVRNSIIKNFMEGGRPEKWRPSKRALAEGGMTLVDTARLQNSIKSKAFANRAEVGTNVIYAAIHQFGFKGGVSIPQHTMHVKSRDIRGKYEGKRRLLAKGLGVVKAHTRKMNILARPFLMVQDEDWTEIKLALTDYLMKGVK